MKKDVILEDPVVDFETEIKQEETPKPKEEGKARAPFPVKTIQPNIEVDQDVLDTFRKVEVNIPLLDAIQQIPRYAKFLKQLCSNKKRLQGKVSVGENVSAIIQKRLPPKFKDPGRFSIPCSLGEGKVNNAMLDLGASLSVMPFYVYSSLNLGPLEPTNVVLQLADRSLVNPEGVLEDVLMKVKHLVFPVDIYVLQMENEETKNQCPLLLGRPFLKTSHTKIDVFDGSLTMEFDGELISFKKPNDNAAILEEATSTINFVERKVPTIQGGRKFWNTTKARVRRMLQARGLTQHKKE